MHVTRLLLMLVAMLLGGCESMGYYLQSAEGQLDLMNRSRAISEVLKDEQVPESTRERLRLVKRIRQFAVTHLALPENDSYRDYVDVGREAVVWSVVATPALSLEPYQWCYPVIGCASYRGYFSHADAQAYAQRLQAEGWDTAVERVPAYSTLGWFDDPLPSTVIDWPESDLAGLIFHELAHQRVYAADDSAFNESYASVVEKVGVRRWLLEASSEEALSSWRLKRRREREFGGLIGDLRRELEGLYQSDQRREVKLLAKDAGFERLRGRYQALKKRWGGYAGFDRWMGRELNNAHLASFQTYSQWVPALRQLLADSGGDLKVFHQRCRELAKLRVPQRRQALLGLQKRALASNAPGHPASL